MIGAAREGEREEDCSHAASITPGPPRVARPLAFSSVALAARLPVPITLAIGMLLEAALVLWIRDSLLLNLLMLLAPIDAVRRWQQGASRGLVHPPGSPPAATVLSSPSRKEEVRMATIFVDTDHSATRKLYDASKAGKAATKAEEKMQKVVQKLEKTPGFTIKKSDGAKGYTIKLKVTKVDTVANLTKCSVSGEILQYPLTFTKGTARGKEEQMVSVGWTGNGNVTGHADDDIVFCIESIVEAMMKDGISKMRVDMAKREN